MDQVEEKMNTSPKIKLTSPKVVFIFCIGVLRNLSAFYYACQIMYVGTLYINDDNFVTLAILLSLTINFVFKLGFGPIVKKINFFNTIYLCEFFSILNGVFGLGLYFTESKIFYVLYTFASRATMSLLLNINYTLPYKLFGTENGLYLMRVLDFQTIPGIIISSVLNYIFVFCNHFHLIFFFLIFFDILCMFLVSIFLKRYSQSKTQSPS